MPHQLWVAPREPIHVADGTALANSTTLTDISPAPPVVIGANEMTLGAELEIIALCTFSTTGTPTLLTGFYLGGIAGAALAASSAVATGTGAASWPLVLFYRGRVRSIGASGSIYGQGTLQLGTSLTAFTSRAIPETAAGRTVTWDTTTARSITVGAQWGTANAANTIVCNEISVLLLN